jgi:LmbE family N-acetylglucosaminyl deacetylase
MKIKKIKKLFLILTPIIAIIIAGLFVFVILIEYFPNVFYPKMKFNKMSEIQVSDRILILAPHPDDEAIAASGVIQKSLEAGARVKVAYLTNGDANQLSFMIFEKKLVAFPKQFIHSGELRRKESIAGMKALGLNDNDLIYLGYPDFGTLSILYRYWGNTNAYDSPITHNSKVPYPECLSPGALYKGESIINDLKSVISDFKPTKIFVSSPVDLNKDHRALYLFTQVVLWDLWDKLEIKPVLFTYLVHSNSFPDPKGYRPLQELLPPQAIMGDEITWSKLELTSGEVLKKYNVIQNYKSQIKYKPSFLVSFARSDELFGQFSNISLYSQNNINIKDIKWQGVGLIHGSNFDSQYNQGLLGLSYAVVDKDMYVKVGLKRLIDKDFGISIFLLGYSKSRDFSNMPKIHVIIGATGIKIMDKNSLISAREDNLVYEGNSLIIKVPLDDLGNPDYILSSAETKAHDILLDATAWRVIILN